MQKGNERVNFHLSHITSHTSNLLNSTVEGVRGQAGCTAST